LGAAYVPPTALSTKIQNKLTGNKRRAPEQEPVASAMPVDEDGDEDSRSAAVSKSAAGKFTAFGADAPKKKSKVTAPTTTNTIKPPPTTGFKPPPTSTASTGTTTPAIVAPISADGAEEEKGKKKQRKKVRSRQKNLRKDKYDIVWGGGGC
jgi:hypothetical protein